MKAFLVANPKGGSGKSTLATNLAGYFANQGLRSHARRHRPPAIVARMAGIRPSSCPPSTPGRSATTTSPGRPKAPRMSCSTPRPACTARCWSACSSCRRGSSCRSSRRCSTCWRRAISWPNCCPKKAVRKGKADVAVIGMRVDARTRAAGELERFSPPSTCRCWPICAIRRLCAGHRGRHDPVRPAALARRARHRTVAGDHRLGRAG